MVAISEGVDIQLSPDQKEAVDAIERWLDTPSYARGDIVLGGYAGSGKSTVVSYLYPRLRDAGILFMGPTAKSVDVLRTKGMLCSTIHQAIYIFKGLKERWNGDEVPIFEDREGWKGSQSPRILGVDEASMVNGKLYNDIHSRGLSCLWVGDHFQLPPVGDDPGLMKNPTVRLEKIHRQAEGSSILRMAHSIRQGNGFRKEDVDNKSTFLVKLPTESHRVGYAIDHGITQTIVSFNNTRINFNKIYRQKTGKTGVLDVGDRIVITQNDWDQMLFNGQFYTVTNIVDDLQTYVVADVVSPHGKNRKGLKPQKLSFGNPDYKKSMRDETLIEADYAYASTCHRCQGDSYDRVMYVDQPCKLWPVDRHRYTGVTRAVSQIHVAY